MKLKTVNVVELDVDNCNLLGINSFRDNPKGNEEAAQWFRKCMIDNGDNDGQEIEACLEDGFYQENGYYISITHSS